MKTGEKLKALDKWLDDDAFEDSVIEHLKAFHSGLGIQVYHCARKSTGYVGQWFEIRYKGEVYKLTFADQIKATIANLLEMG